jgi:hypothetical protein
MVMETKCQQNINTEVSIETTSEPTSWQEACAESARRAGVKSTPHRVATDVFRGNAEAIGEAAKPSSSKAGEMNKLETKYSQHLELRRQAGEILHWKFEPLKLRLAQRTYYNVDFSVVLAGGAIEMHETKGFWRDDARVKIKVAAEHFPEYNFVGVRWHRELGWQFENIPKGENHGR